MHTTRRVTIARFGRTERAAHWLVAATVLTMLATGLDAGDDGGPLLVVHVGAAVTLVVGLVLLTLVGDGSALARLVRDAARIDADDRAWLAARRPFSAARSAPPAGRLNGGQKLAARVVGALLLLDLASGVLLVVGTPAAGVIHSAVASALAVVIAGHVFMAVANPATRGALRGIVTGRVDRAWALRHHGRWVAEQDRTTTARPAARPVRTPLHTR
jgi:formate dehydrogenase subunit gamma